MKVTAGGDCYECDGISLSLPSTAAVALTFNHSLHIELPPFLPSLLPLSISSFIFLPYPLSFLLPLFLQSSFIPSPTPHPTLTLNDPFSTYPWPRTILTLTHPNLKINPNRNTNYLTQRISIRTGLQGTYGSVYRCLGRSIQEPYVPTHPWYWGRRSVWSEWE